MDWVQFATFIVVNTVFTLTLWLWNRTESRADNRQMLSMMQGMQTIIVSIKDEMKDFHGRLERQDAEFKGRLALQDAEFKAHLMHHHQK